MGYAFLSGKKIAILGLGRTGLESARFLHHQGIEVWAWDDGQAARLQAKAEGIPVVDLLHADLTQVEALLFSPGIPHTYPKPHPVAVRAQEMSCRLISDIELFAQAIPIPRKIGITGTNGKSTTTALIHHILQTVGLPACIGGNFGPAALSLPLLEDHGVYVLELSSYQLELSHDLACDVALLLNITPDHLARHGGMAGYVAAKKRLFELQQKGHSIAVIGLGTTPAEEIYQQLLKERPQEVYAFGPCTEQQLAQKENSENTPDICYDPDDLSRLFLSYAAKRKPFFRSFPEEGLVLPVIPVLQGAHNVENMAAALLSAAAMGLAWDRMIEAMRCFPGLAHRLQPVAVSLGGPILCVNDSKATNAEATAKALASYQTIFWIAGGQAKEGGVKALRDLLAPVAQAFLIGECASEFQESLQGYCETSRYETLSEALPHAYKAAMSYLAMHPETQPVILLSPAAASWDQYQSFEARGDEFCRLVTEMLTK